ncbi:hypothetical protein Tco_0083414 [Tanacetum coccineum]
MGDEHLSTIPEKESDEVIKSSVEDLVPILSESEDTSDNDRGDIDEINAFLDMDVSTDIEDNYYDSEGDTIYLESLLIEDIIPNLPPEVFCEHDPTSLKDEHDNDNLKNMIKIFLPFLTYPMNSLLLFSSGSEDTIFDPDISAYSFYFLEPVIAPDYEDSCARGFVHRSLKLQSLACLYMGI